MDADQILVLDKGRVAEQGTHTELIEAGGVYASMWSRQQDLSLLTPATSSLGLSRGITPVPKVPTANGDDSADEVETPRDTDDLGATLGAAVQGSGSRRGPVRLLMQQQEQEEDSQQLMQQQVGLADILEEHEQCLRCRDSNLDTEDDNSSYDGSVAGGGRGYCRLHQSGVNRAGGEVRQLLNSRSSIRRYRQLRRHDTSKLFLLISSRNQA